MTIATIEISMVDDVRYLYFPNTFNDRAASMYIRKNVPMPKPWLKKNSDRNAPNGPP